MKNLIITISLVFCLTGTKAQINFEHQYDTGSMSIGYGVRLVHFSAHGYLYMMINPSAQHGMIELYNLNHSLYKQFAIPPQQQAGLYGRLNVGYVSDSLFNTNPSNFEYFVDFTDTATHFFDSRIYDDAGNIIFSKDSVSIGWAVGTLPYCEPVEYSPQGYKMILEKGMYGKTAAYVYGLPGALPCHECSNNNIISAIGGGPNNGSGNNGGSLQNAYPNPTSYSTNIKYELPEGINQGQIVFYDLNGKELKSFTVDRTFDTLNVSTADLASGTYFYVLRTNKGIVGDKKVIVIR